MRENNENSSSKAFYERGSALVMAIFVLVILTGMAVALLFLSQNEVKMSTASLRAKQAFYVAEAGIESGRMKLFATNGGGAFTDDLEDASSDGAIDFDPSAIQAVYDGNGNPIGFTGYGDDVPLSGPTALGDHLYAAFLTNDPDEPSPGVLSTTDTNDRVMITGVGAGPGNSFEVVQAIVELELLFPALPPSTITLTGPSPFFDGGMSKAKEYVGDDCKGAGIPGLYVPAIGVTESSSVDPCTVGSPDPSSVRCGIYAPTTYYTGPYVGEDTAADVTDPGVFGGAGPIHPSYLDCWFMHDLVDRVREAADVICPEGKASDCALPPSDPSRVIFVDGDFFIGAWDDGEGMVFVTGELWFHGDSAWSGTAWAVGEGVMWRYGGGTESIVGSVFVADIAGPDNTYGTADDCTGGINGFGESVYNAQGGGSGDVVYCSNVILDSLPPAPYDVVDFLQR